jgi:hypothetical protein
MSTSPAISAARRRPGAPSAIATEERETSRVAVNALARLAPLWRLTDGEMAALVGVSLRNWARMKSGQWMGRLSQDQLLRASALIGLFKGLRLLFSLPLADDWVRLPNAHPLFGGRAPLAAMAQGGIPTMLEVRRLVDALRGGV